MATLPGFAKLLLPGAIIERYVQAVQSLLAERRAELDLPESAVFSYALDDLRREIVDLTQATLIESQLAGFLAPWFPDLNPHESAKREGSDPLPVLRQMAITRPSLDEAHAYLEKQMLDWPETFAGVVTREQVAAASRGLQCSQSLLNRLNRELDESIKAGEGREGWSKRLGAIVETRPGFAEVVGRTAHHRAFNEGQTRVLEKPIAREIFPYRKYLITDDNRVRPAHKKLADRVYHRMSALADECTRALGEYNCRCSQVPLTEADAVAEGIDPEGMPPDNAELSRSVPLRALDELLDEEKSQSVETFRKDQEARVKAENIRSRFAEIDPLGLDSEVEASVSPTYRVESAERGIDGNWRVKVEGESRPIVVPDDGEIRPGQTMSFKVAGATDEEVLATGRVEKTVSLTILAPDRYGQYHVLVSPVLNALPSVKMGPNETRPQDAAARFLRSLPVGSPGSLIPTGSYRQPFRVPGVKDSWSYSFSVRATDEVSSDQDAGGFRWVTLADALTSNLFGDHSQILSAAVRGLVRVLSSGKA